jgi:hypothetical protein
MRPIACLMLACLALPIASASAEVPEAIAVPGQSLIATVHAEGAQVYECKADAAPSLRAAVHPPEHPGLPVASPPAAAARTGVPGPAFLLPHNANLSRAPDSDGGGAGVRGIGVETGAC